MEAFLFSLANSCPSHQATSCHVILHHFISYYVIYPTCIQILSSVKYQLISPFMEWHGAYVLGQICIEFICEWGRGVKKLWTLLVINIFGTSGISLSYLPVPPLLRNVHELMCRGGGWDECKQNRFRLDSHQI